jgi:PAS domain S-box-containing protein
MATHQANHTSQTGEQRYRHLFEHAPLCIFVIDLTVSPPTIQEINRQAELVYGYPAAELVGMPAAQLVPQEALPVILTTVQRVQQGQTVTTETTSRHRDGTRFSARMIATPDPTDSGHMIVTVEDITPDKERRSEAEAIDAERRRIAHEIHDGVAQSLAGLRFKSALWSHRADAPPACAPRWTRYRPCLPTPSPICAGPSLACARWTWRRWAFSGRCHNWWPTLATSTS